jgi:hypothetical protein
MVFLRLELGFLSFPFIDDLSLELGLRVTTISLDVMVFYVLVQKCNLESLFLWLLDDLVYLLGYRPFQRCVPSWHV